MKGGDKSEHRSALIRFPTTPLVERVKEKRWRCVLAVKTAFVEKTLKWGGTGKKLEKDGTPGSVITRSE